MRCAATGNAELMFSKALAADLEVSEPGARSLSDSEVHLPGQFAVESRRIESRLGVAISAPSDTQTSTSYDASMTNVFLPIDTNPPPSFVGARDDHPAPRLGIVRVMILCSS